MANITISLPDELYRRVRIRAAEENTSVSGLVRQLLVAEGERETGFERLKRLQDETIASIRCFSAGDRVTRDEVHDRVVR